MDRIVLFFIITLFYCIVSSIGRDEKIERVVFIVLTSIVLVLASALRGLSVGPDTHQYYELFEEVKDYSFKEIWQSMVSNGPITKDPFYSMFEKVFQLFSVDYNAYLGLVAILFCSSLGNFLYKNNLTLKELYVSYVFYLGLFYGFYSITGIRQTIAVAFTMYAYTSLLNKKTLSFLLFTFVAYLFHASAIVFLLSFFIIRIKNLKALTYCVLLCLPVIFIFRYEIFSYFIVASGLDERFIIYMEESYGGSLAVLTLYVVVLIAVLLNLRSIPPKSKIENHIKMYMVCMLGLPLLFVSGSGMRITQYFSVSMFVLVPYFTSGLRVRSKYFLAVLFMFLLIVIAYRDQPYVFYWQ